MKESISTKALMKSEGPPVGCMTRAIVGGFLLLTCGLGGPLVAQQPAFDFFPVDVEQAGIDFRHFDGSSGKYFIVETMSAGLALLDFDQDGDVDIYFVNGAAQPGTTPREARNRLYRNDGNWKFTDVTQSAGVGDTGHGLGVAVGDYNNDGAPDIYVTNFGANVLYRNNGDGSFIDATKAAGVSGGIGKVSVGTAFLDIENDGDLDLYVGNYIQFTHAKHVPRTKGGYPIYGSPGDYKYDRDQLFRNNGDGTFTEIGEQAGIATKAGPSMGLVCADVEGDGDTDIFVANDGFMNFLFKNDGKGRFRESALLMGFAYDMAGQPHASMGVACRDYDHDGQLDFHVTSYQAELATLYKNVGGQFLQDVTTQTGAAQGTRAPVTWGNAFGDFDNDGLPDLFVACGHLYDQLAKFDQSTEYEAKNLLLQNLGNGRFRNVTEISGAGLQVKASSRGVAFDDLDNDGDLDAVVVNIRREPTLLRNDSQPGNHWLQISLEGRRSNRSAVGTRVELVAGGQRQIAERHSGHGYQSHFGERLHFGLGKQTIVDEIQIRWPSGTVEKRKNVKADQRLYFVEPSAGPSPASD